MFRRRKLDQQTYWQEWTLEEAATPNISIAVKARSILSEDDDQYLPCYDWRKKMWRNCLLGRRRAGERLYATRSSELDLRSWLPSRLPPDDYSSLLAYPDGQCEYNSKPNTSKQHISFERHRIGCPELEGILFSGIKKITIEKDNFWTENTEPGSSRVENNAKEFFFQI